MKTFIAQISAAIIAVVVFTVLMSYTRPAPEEAKQYTIVFAAGKHEGLEPLVNQKLAEGWRLQGGVAVSGGGHYQAMVK